jgi:DNA-binding response OmpR family regulator
MKPLTIFIVDDDRDFAESLQEVLSTAGHQAELCFDGESAVKIFRERTFDLILMDVKLPGKNGVESFLAMRAIRPRARVVMMTAYSVEQLLQEAIQRGAVGVLRKPFDPARVLGMLADMKPDGVILMADDDPDFSDSTRNLLARRGYNVLVARTGEQALSAALADGIDILVLDLRLPVLSGLEVYLELKRRGRSLPTIIVTGYAAEEAETIDKLRTLSVTGFLVKPFAPQDLLNLIGAIEDKDFQTTWFPPRPVGE